MQDAISGTRQPMTQMTQEEISHDTRKKIDAIIGFVKMQKDDKFTYMKGKRELALAYTKLREAKMWMGKVLEELGSELPKEFQDKA